MQHCIKWNIVGGGTVRDLDANRPVAEPVGITLSKDPSADLRKRFCLLFTNALKREGKIPKTQKIKKELKISLCQNGTEKPGEYKLQNE